MSGRNGRGVFRAGGVAAALGCAVMVPASAWAGSGGEVPGLASGLPFVGVLLSIALGPILVPRLWHRWMGTIAAFWSLARLLPLAATAGVSVAAAAAWHAVLIEYLPFLLLLLALFATGGGILLRGGPSGQPASNTALLAVGTVLAGLMGTTGAAMVLIHPLLRANAYRTRKVHLVVFFTILVANAGGAMTPLGDPPLFLGFLHGVPFGWPARHMALPLLTLVLPLLLVFYLLDHWFSRGDTEPPERERLRLRGWVNVVLLLLVVATVFAEGIWRFGKVPVLGQPIEVERLAGMAVMLGVALASIVMTPLAVRQANMFTWAPLAEVAKLFFAIFITIGPVMTMLIAGLEGPLGPMLRLTQGVDGQDLPYAYFWLTGMLSAFLDNAPTYLVFFELAGGDPATLTGELNHVLRAVSAGAVFFGALTYIGNAPNLMVRSIAAHRGVRMPGFFGFMAWTTALLVPLFAVLTLVFFW
jgi:Na+/H+ antiporter NhaD/arsenite permease-like protein